MVFNSIIRTKLIYGLESAQLNDSLKKYIDTFHLKGLRKILGLKHTYIDRLNTNEKIYREAEIAMNINNTGAHKQLVKLSDYYEQQRLKTIASLIHFKERPDARVSITFDKATLNINEYPKKRRGRPKNAWWNYALQFLWSHCQKNDTNLANVDLCLNKPAHIQAIEAFSKKITEEHQRSKRPPSPPPTPHPPPLSPGPLV